MSGTESPRVLYLGAAHRAAFATVHPAASPSGAAAILVPPFGWEEVASYRCRRTWAARLAAAGTTALRLDLPGTGDSAGGPLDDGLLDAWTDAVADAARWLTAQGCAPVAAIGIGLGGTVAALAVGRGAPIADLVLWGAPAQGRRYLRELRAFGRLEAAAGPPGERSVPEGAVAAGGFVLAPPTAAAVAAIDLGSAHVDGIQRALVLSRDGLDVSAAATERLRRAGADVTVADGPGYAAMMSDPLEAAPPDAVMGIVANWLRGGDGHDRPASGATPPSAATLDLGRAHEAALMLPRPAGSLFGLATTPAGSAVDATALFLNAGAQRHTGPNRMWVEMARRWADRGVPAVRVDLAGIGDSDGEPRSDRVERVDDLYTPGYVEQVRAWCDTLVARGLPPRFVAVGLCSGAYWGFQAAVADQRIAAVLMLNPRALIWDPRLEGARESRRVRKVARAETWRRLASGSISPRRGLEVARAVIIRAAGDVRHLPRALGQRRRARAIGGDALDLALDGLRDRDVPALLLFSGGEPLHEELQRDGRLAGLARWPNLRLELISEYHDTHTLQPLGLQRRVHAIADEVLAAVLARDAGAGDRPPPVVR